MLIISQLSRKWFPPEEASLKRPVIKKLIDKILEEPSFKIPPADSIAMSPLKDTCNQETEVMFLEKIGSPVKTCHDTASSSNTEKIGISLAETSLSRGGQCFKESGVSSGSSIDAKLQFSAPNRRSVLSPIEVLILFQLTARKISSILKLRFLYIQIHLGPLSFMVLLQHGYLFSFILDIKRHGYFQSAGNKQYIYGPNLKITMHHAW